MYLLDTDAVSELEKPVPDPNFLSWINSVDWFDLHLSVITIGEIWKGIAALPIGRKRRQLEAMIQMIPDRFHERGIPVDQAVAVQFGAIRAGACPSPTLG